MPPRSGRMVERRGGDTAREITPIRAGPSASSREGGAHTSLDLAPVPIAEMADDG